MLAPVRAAAALVIVQLAGCSTLLGIQNPSTGIDGSVDSSIDAGIDGNPQVEHLELSATAFQLTQLQTARLHVVHVLTDGSREDVTATATLTSDDQDVAATGDSGVVIGGTRAGTTTIHASFGTVIEATATATVTAVMCHPVINELATGSMTSPADEWVEVYNPCVMMIDVTGWSLFYRAATNTGPTDTGTVAPLTSALAAMSNVMGPLEFRLYAGAGYTGTNDGKFINTGASGVLQQNNGAVGLRDAASALVDSIAYGAVTAGNPFIEGTAAMAMANGLSASRLPFDGNDDGNNAADVMVIAKQTPRAPNAP